MRLIDREGLVGLAQRELKGLTQEEIAEELGTTQQAVSLALRGKRTRMLMTIINQLTRYEVERQEMFRVEKLAED